MSTDLQLLRELEGAGAISATSLTLPDGTEYPKAEALFAYFGKTPDPALVAWWEARTAWEGECLLWTKSRLPSGYGKGAWRENGRQHFYYAHRRAYEEFVGPIPEGLVIDHLCRQPPCVNPLHLEPVTQQTNLVRGEGFPGQQARQTECVHGHPLSGENLYEHDGHRYCKTCRREANRAAYTRRTV